MHLHHGLYTSLSVDFTVQCVQYVQRILKLFACVPKMSLCFVVEDCHIHDLKKIKALEETGIRQRENILKKK